MPSKWEIHRVDLEPVRGHEQKGTGRPCVVVSTDRYNHSRAGMVMVLPVTDALGADGKPKAAAGVPWNVLVGKGHGGLTKDSLVKADQLRSVAVDRLAGAPLGTITDEKIQQQIEHALRLLLDLD